MTMRFTATQIAKQLEGEVLGDGSVEITGFAPAAHARAGDLTFAEKESYFATAEQSQASAILVSGDFVKKHKLESKAVEIAGMAMSTDLPSTFDDKSCIALVGADMTKKAAERAYAESGLGPENVDVVELHDCFSTNELITYEGLGLCPPGKGGELIDSGAVTYGGKWVVNPSGGLACFGEAVPAQALAQVCELTWQLRGEAGERQVAGATVGISANQGLFGHGSSVVLAV